MRTFALLTLAVLTTLPFSSCGSGCGCGVYNSDYLRDVPTTRTQSFD